MPGSGFAAAQPQRVSEQLQPGRFPAEPVLQQEHHKPLFLQRCFQGLTTKGFCTKGPRAPLSVSLKSLTFLAKKGNDPAARSTGTSGFYPCHEWVMAMHSPVPDLQEGEGDVMHKHPSRLPECGSKTVMKILLSTGEQCRGEGRAGAAAQGEVGAGKLAGSPGQHWGCRKRPSINQMCPSCACLRHQHGIRDCICSPKWAEAGPSYCLPQPQRGVPRGLLALGQGKCRGESRTLPWAGWCSHRAWAGMGMGTGT